MGPLVGFGEAVVPRYMTAHAAGFDLCAALDTPLVFAPGPWAAVLTGLAMAAPLLLAATRGT